MSPRGARLSQALGAVLLTGSLAACAGLPTPPEAAAPTTVPPVVTADQAQRIEVVVAERVAAAAVDPALLEAAETGPALALSRARVALSGTASEAAPRAVGPAQLLVAPTVDGWPRWFLTVEAPAGSEATDEVSAAPSVAAEPSAESVAAPSGPPTDAAVPVLRLYAGSAARSPYLLWGELTLLPGAAIPAFDAAELGAAVPGAAEAAATGDPTTAADAAVDGDPTPDTGLGAAVSDLTSRYAEVLTAGDAGQFAAQFQPDPFVLAVRERAAAEAAAVAEVADVTVTHEPYTEAGGPFVALSADGGALVVTAVRTTTTATVRSGEGILQPGADLAALAGVNETSGSLTSTSIAILAFVVPPESGAIRLVAVSEGLVAATAS